MNRNLYDACVKFMMNGRYAEALDCIKHLYEEDSKAGKKIVDAFRGTLTNQVDMGYNIEENMELLHQAYILTAPDYFDDFMIAAEWYRPADQKFWLVRREKLLKVCNALQKMAEGELDELFLSMPPRVGKSTLVLFYTIWRMCRDTEQSNLYSSFTEKVVETYYNGVLEVLSDPVTYDLKTIFPKLKMANTNAKDLLVNLGRKKRYPSLTCRSIDGSLNGSCDASGLVIADDIHSGIDEARNKELLDKKWQTVTNNLLSRKKSEGQILWIGTRWSVVDCISNRLQMLETDSTCSHIRYEVVNVPALDDNGESNFDYMYRKGFTTKDYAVIHASFAVKDDEASWLAQYMGTPIERDGAVFSPSDMRYYNGVLPEADPDRIFMVCDPAWGGGDFTAAPVIYQYGDDLFIHDVVFDDGDKTITQPKIANMVMKHNVAALTIEATRTTASYAEGIDQILKSKEYRVNMQTTTKNWTGTGKAQRIFDTAPEIKERMVFLERSKRGKEYNKFMQNVYSFTITQNKRKHDDAPDSLALAIKTAFLSRQKATIVKRWF